MTPPIKSKKQQLELQIRLLKFAEEIVSINSGSNAEANTIDLVESECLTIAKIFNEE